MAATAWTIQIRMMTASTAPRMFRTIRDEAKKTESSVTGLTRTVKDIPQSFDKSLSNVSRGFQQVNRAAGGFARTVRAATRVSAADFGAVTSSLNNVRATANSAANAVKQIANAARSIPKNIKVNGNVGAGAGGSGSGGGMNPATLGAAAGGALAGGMLWGGIQRAGTVQDASTAIALGLGATGKSFDETQQKTATWRSLALRLSMMTAQDMPTTLGLIQNMSTSIKNPAQLAAIMPDVARVADTMYLNPAHHVAFAESTTEMARLAHMFGAYSAADMKPLAEATYRLGFSSPDRLSRMVTQLGYFGEDYARAMMRPGDSADQKAAAVNETLRLALLGDVSIGHGKWGSGYDRMIRDLIHPTSDAKFAGQVNMGLRDKHGALTRGVVVDAQGRFTPERMIQYLSDRYEKMDPMSRLGVFASGFNVTAARVLGGAANPKALNYLHGVQGTMANMPSLETAQEQLMGSLSSKQKLAASNWGSFLTVVGTSLVPELTSLTGAVADLLGKLTVFLYDHPRAAKAAAIGLGITAAAGGVASLALGGYVAHGAFKGILHHVGNHGLEAAIAEGASHAAGGGWRGMLGAGAGFVAGGAGRFGRFATRASGVGAVGSARSFGGVAKTMIGDLLKLGPTLFRTRGGFLLIAETLAKLGLRAIPVVGEVLMLIDTIKFLGNHSFDVGKLIGSAARLIVDGLRSVWGALMGLFKNIAWVASHPIQAATGGVGGLWNWGVGAVKNFGAGVVAGYTGHDPRTPKPNNVIPFPAGGRGGTARPVAMATGGYVRSNGLAFLHKNEVVVNDRLTRKLDRLTDGGGFGGRRELRITIASEIPNDRRALRQLARAIAGELGHDVELDARAGGSTPQITGHSHYSIEQGRRMA